MRADSATASPANDHWEFVWSVLGMSTGVLMDSRSWEGPHVLFDVEDNSREIHRS